MGQQSSHPQLVAELKEVLSKECMLLEQYHKALIAEREYLRQMKKPEHTDELMLLTAQRDVLCQQVQQCTQQRLQAVKIFKEPRGTRFSAILSRNLNPQEMQTLDALIARLKMLAERTQKESFEFKQVVDFALNLVGGLGTMISSAAQNVVRSYGRGGKVKESFHPANGRSQRVLKQA